MSHNRSPDQRTDPRSGWHPAARCRYELAYVTPEERSAHERWLFEWAMDLLEVDDVVDVSLVRVDEGPLSVTVRVDVRTASGVTALDERYQALVTALSDRADDLWIQRYRREEEAIVDR